MTIVRIPPGGNTIGVHPYRMLSPFKDLDEVRTRWPINDELHGWRSTFYTMCDWKELPRSPDSVDMWHQDDLWEPILLLLHAIAALPGAAKLASRARPNKCVHDDIPDILRAVTHYTFDLGCLKPLLKEAIADHPRDGVIWYHVFVAANHV